MSQKGIPKNKPKICETHPQFVDWMCDKNDAKRHSYGAKTKIDWICPNCGSKVDKISIVKVIGRKRVPCKVCSDGVSYPNKYMYNMLLQINEEFTSEYMPDWIKPKRYDFYIPSKNLIIEMDGNLGHGRKTFDGRTPEETLMVDEYKDILANQHGLDVVRIDCIESDSDYIKNSILNSKLSTLFDLSNVDFLLCNKYAYSSLKMRVCDVWNQYHEMENILQETKLPRETIIKYLKDCAKYGLCDYDPKLQMKRSGQRNIYKACFSNSIKIICTTTGEIFNSVADAYRWLGYNPDGHTIQDNCKGKQKTAGRHPITKEKLSWMFYDEYLKLEGCS